MKPIHPDMVEAWEAEAKRQEALLREHGWTQTTATFTYSWNNEEYEAECWIDPRSGYKHVSSRDAYDRLTEYILADHGWRTIVEVKKCDKLVNGVQEWARYQSPKTKKVYTYLDAQYVMENNWDESGYPEFCCGHTVDLNNLIGDNFDGNILYTWFGRRGDQYVLELRDPD